MARFVFNLQSLLNARLAAERQRQRALAQLQRKRNALEERLRQQQQMIAAGRQGLREGLIGAVDLVGLRAHAASSMRLLRDGQRMAVDLGQVYERIERARADLAEAAAARRAMELLRERRFAEWKRTQEKREAAMQDDLASSKAARGKMSEEFMP